MRLCLRGRLEGLIHLFKGAGESESTGELGVERVTGVARVNLIFYFALLINIIASCALCKGFGYIISNKMIDY